MGLFNPTSREVAVRISTVVIVLALGCLCSPRLSAQGPGTGPVILSGPRDPVWRSYRSGRPHLNSWHPRVSGRTCWLEGGVIGLVALGLVS